MNISLKGDIKYTSQEIPATMKDVKLTAFITEHLGYWDECRIVVASDNNLQRFIVIERP